MKSTSEVKEFLKSKGFNPHVLSKNKKGNYVYRKEFFYQTNSAEKIAESLKNEIPEIEIIETKNIWKSFRGGASTQNSSHYYIEFRLNS